MKRWYYIYANGRYVGCEYAKSREEVIELRKGAGPCEVRTK